MIRAQTARRLCAGRTEIADPRRRPWLALWSEHGRQPRKLSEHVPAYSAPSPEPEQKRQEKQERRDHKKKRAPVVDAEAPAAPPARDIKRCARNGSAAAGTTGHSQCYSGYAK